LKVGKPVDDVVVAAGHGVPPLDLGHGISGRGGKCQRGRDHRSCPELSKIHQKTSRWTVIINRAR